MHRQQDQAPERDLPPVAATAVTVPVSLLTAVNERMARTPAPRPAPEPLAGQAAGPGPWRESAAGRDEPVQDPRIAAVAGFLAEVRARATGARSWLESSEHYAQLLNAEGFVPVTARFDARDLKFLGQAREDLLAFAELVSRLAGLHRPLDAGGISSDPANPALRCHSCMSRWPCPTFRLITGILTESGAA